MHSEGQESVARRECPERSDQQPSSHLVESDIRHYRRWQLRRRKLAQRQRQQSPLSTEHEDILKWKAEDRHRIALGMPANILVSAFRVPDSDLNWVQGLSSGLLFPAGFDPRLSQGLLGMMHICNIRIHDIVGTVVKYPWQLAHSEIVLPGVPLWTREGSVSVDLDRLPLEKDMYSGLVTGEWKDSPLLGRPTIDSVDFFEA